MAVGLLISLPEGLEAFLIIAFLGAYLVQNGQKSNRPALILSAVLAVVISVAVSALTMSGGLKLEVKTMEILRMGLALIGTVLITDLMVWTGRQTNAVRTAEGLGTAFALPPARLLMLLALAFIVVLREVLETAAFTAEVALSSSGAELLPGMVLGLALGAGIAVLCYFLLSKLATKNWLLASGLLFALAAVGLGGHAIDSLGQLGFLPSALAQLAWDTNWLAPQNSLLGRMLHTFIGYNAAPNLLGVVFYLVYLIAVGARLLSALGNILDLGAEDLAIDDLETES